VLARWLTAFGLWKTSAVAFVLMFVTVFAHIKLRAPKAAQAGGNEMPVEFFTAFLTMFVAVTVSGWYSMLAAFSALRHGVRVWLGRRENLGSLVLISSGLVFLVLVGFGISMPVALLLGRTFPAAAGIVLVVGMVVMPAGTILVLKDRLEQRILAPTPEECWDVAWKDRKKERRVEAIDPHLATIDEFGLEA
jgi:hypothetical protein